MNANDERIAAPALAPRPRVRRPRAAVLAALTVGALVAVGAAGRGTEAEPPAPAVQERVARLQASRRHDLEEQARHERDLAAIRTRVDALRRRRQVLRATVDRQRAHLAALRKTLAQREEVVTTLRAAVRRSAGPAREVAHAVLDEIRHAPPVADASQARPFEIAARPGSTAVTEAETADALAALVGACSEALPILRTAAVEGRRVHLPDGRVLHAFVLRLGAVHALFVSEDGATLGAWNRSTQRWTTSLPDKSERAVREALAIARGRRRAGLVAVPLWPGTNPQRSAGGTR